MNQEHDTDMPEMVRKARSEAVLNSIVAVILGSIGFLIFGLAFRTSENRWSIARMAAGVCILCGAVVAIRDYRDKQIRPLACGVISVLVFIGSGIALLLSGSSVVRTYYREMIDISYESSYDIADLRCSADLIDKKTIRSYKKAAWIDRYLLTWNDDTELPGTYAQIGWLYASCNDFDNGRDYLTRSVALYRSLGCEEQEAFAAAAFYLVMNEAGAGNKDAVTEYGEIVSSWYDAHPDALRTTLRAADNYLFLGQAYYDLGAHEQAAACFEKGIPLLYELADWAALDDKMNAVLYACSCKCAALNAEVLGDSEKSADYQKQFEDFMWLYDYTEKDLDDYRNYFHWMGC